MGKKESEEFCLGLERGKGIVNVLARSSISAIRASSGDSSEGCLMVLLTLTRSVTFSKFADDQSMLIKSGADPSVDSQPSAVREFPLKILFNLIVLIIKA